MAVRSHAAAVPVYSGAHIRYSGATVPILLRSAHYFTPEKARILLRCPLGRIPRSHEGHQEDALAAVERCGADPIANSPKAVIFFYSHRWARGNWCEELQRELPWGSEEYKQAVAEGKLVGDPDDAAHSKARALAAYGEWFRKGLIYSRNGGEKSFHFGVWDPLSGDANVEIFWWIDWCCTDQVSRGTTEGAAQLLLCFSLRARTRVPCRRERASAASELAPSAPPPPRRPLPRPADVHAYPLCHPRAVSSR